MTARRQNDGVAGGDDRQRVQVPKLLRVVAAAIIHDGRVLLASKQAAPDVYYLPGGKPERGERRLTTLMRELAEELGVGVVEHRLLLVVRDRAALEGCPMEIATMCCRSSAALGRFLRALSKL